MTDTINHLQMADDLLRDVRHGDGPKEPGMLLIVISHVLIAFVERSDQGLHLLAEIAETLELQRWGALTPDQRTAELRFNEELTRREETPE